VPPIADAERRENFDCFDSILLARNELERQLDGRQFKQALQHYQADRNRHVIRCGSMNLLMQPMTRPIRADREEPR
jgi:hypothetical protein